MEPIRRQKIHEQVLESLRGKILSGELAVGQRLPAERDLAARFGVSRVSVREAIHILVLCGMLEVRKGAGGGTFVSEAYDKPLETGILNLLRGGSVTLGHLFALRLLLEPPAAAAAAERARTDGAGPLEDVIARARRCADDPEALREANLEFHRQMVARAGNPLQSVLCEVVIRILVESLRGRPSHATSRRVLAFHERILAAILAGDPAEAEQQVKADLQHLKESYEALGVAVHLGGGQGRSPSLSRRRQT